MNPKEALEISRKVAEQVKNNLSKVSEEDFSSEVGVGKDGTPTKKVDKVAEDVAIEVLREHGVTVVSEEVGVVGEGDVYVALDPIDGTFNAGRGIPLYSVSSRGGKGSLRVYDIGAAAHIATCAGAVVTDTAGNNLDEKRIKMDERFKLVVSNKALHPKLLELVA